MKNALLILIACLILPACGGHGISEKRELTECSHVVDSLLPIKEIMDIAQWGCDRDGNIVVVSEQTDTCVIVFNPDNPETVSKFIPRGAGPDEAQNLNIAYNKENVILIDNIDRRVFTLFPYSSDKRLRDYAMIYNQPSLRHYPLVSVIDKNSSSKIWRLLNIETAETVDSIVLEKSNEPRLFSEPTDFSHCVAEDLFVLAGRQANVMLIGTLDDDGKIVSMTAMEGRDETGSEYYTAVGHYDDKIYLLSQKNVGLNQERGLTGQSEIEIYDLSGNPIKRLCLDFIATKMLVNPQKGKIYLLAIDDTVRMIGLE